MRRKIVFFLFNDTVLPYTTDIHVSVFHIRRQIVYIITLYISITRGSLLSLNISSSIKIPGDGLLRFTAYRFYVVIYNVYMAERNDSYAGQIVTI